MTVIQPSFVPETLPAPEALAPALRLPRAPLGIGAPYVLGLYSSGGGGHVSALDSIETCLQPLIDVRRVAPLREILHRIDPIAQLTLGRFDGELLFNRLAERGHTTLLGMLEKLGTRRVHSRRADMARLLRAALNDHPPALIVSTMPFINAAVSDVAAELGIPFLIVPTDYDLTNFVVGLPTPLPPMQHVLHGFAEQGAQFPGTHVGYPLRPQFAGAVDLARYQALRLAQGIAPHSRVVVITVGSAGGVRALDLAARLSARSQGKHYHLVICCGRNPALLRRARAFAPAGVTVDARGYTTDMPALLGMADAIITKPGGGTVMEALALGVPMVLDVARGCVPWERANLKLAESLGAHVLESSRDVGAKVDAALTAPRTYAAATPFVDFQTSFYALASAALQAADA